MDPQPIVEASVNGGPSKCFTFYTGAGWLTTFDYAGRELILRRRTPEAARKVRADAARAGASPGPAT